MNLPRRKASRRPRGSRVDRLSRLPVLQVPYEAAPQEAPQNPINSYDEQTLSRRVREEALSMFGLVGKNGETVQSIREQIVIAPHIARMLFAFVEERPAEAAWILGSLEFRNRVLREFDRLTESEEHAERIAAAEAEAARRAADAVPERPFLHELVTLVDLQMTL